MSNKNQENQEGKDQGTERAPYEAPAIVYEGLITTRANTGDPPPEQSNPAADVFSSDS